jgi:uncharacterized protein (DUF1501 family)
VSSFQRAADVRNNPAFQALKFGAGDVTGQIDAAIALLAGGTSRAVFIRGGGGFDSHDNYAKEQNDEQNDFFAGLTELVQALAGKPGLLDKTIVVAASEMGRTPKWNSAQKDGKDHWPVTSAMVVGGPVKPGVYGGTDERLNPRRVDLETGKLDAGGELIDYDCFVAGILRMCGVEPKSYLPNVTPLEGFIA